MDLGATTRYRRLGHVSLRRVLALVQAVSDGAWDQFGERNTPGSVHEHARSLVIRYTDRIDDESYYQDAELHRLFWPLVAQVERVASDHFGYSQSLTSRALFAKLPPGGAIPTHVDRGSILESHHRIHVPVSTNDGCELHVDQASVPCSVGDIIEINNGLPHGARNSGSTDRVHLIIDLLGAP